MRSRDASKSDLLVAVTAMDEVNIIACMLAKKNGIPHTIARIRDPKFLSEPVDYIKENFDIDLVLSPELITAREISRLVMTPSAINVEDFAKGRVRLLEMKLSPRSPFAHKELKDITLPPSVLIALILRDHHMIIPHGSDRLLPLDNVYFLGNPESLAEISSHGHAKYQRRTKKALIIGAGRTGQALAPMLEKQGISVKVIDNNEDHCQQMVERLKKGMVLCGDGTDMDMLTQEGVSEADTVICTTKDERLNLMMALLAKHLGAGQTMVRVTRTEYIALMQQVGIDIVLSTRLLAAGEVLAFLIPALLSLLLYLLLRRRNLSPNVSLTPREGTAPSPPFPGLPCPCSMSFPISVPAPSPRWTDWWKACPASPAPGPPSSMTFRPCRRPFFSSAP